METTDQYSGTPPERGVGEGRATVEQQVPRPKIPGIGWPAATRSYAKSGMVARSCVRTIRSFWAAQARMSGSSTLASSTSCVRTRASSGRRRSNPRTLDAPRPRPHRFAMPAAKRRAACQGSPLKFSSVSRRSIPHPTSTGGRSVARESRSGQAGWTRCAGALVRLAAHAAPDRRLPLRDGQGST